MQKLQNSRCLKQNGLFDRVARKKTITKGREQSQNYAKKKYEKANLTDPTFW